jgi:hypothetical protein
LNSLLLPLQFERFDCETYSCLWKIIQFIKKVNKRILFQENFQMDLHIYIKKIGYSWHKMEKICITTPGAQNYELSESSPELTNLISKVKRRLCSGNFDIKLGNNCNK